MVDTSVLISVAAAVAAVGSAIYAGRTLREARKANKIPALLDFLREYRSYEPDRRYVFRTLDEECEPGAGISTLPDDARRHVTRVAHYLDQLGFLVDQRLIDPHAVAGFMGPSVLRSWEVLAPYIRQERAARGSPAYSRYFEDLAARVLAIDPESVVATLRTMPSTGGPLARRIPLAGSRPEPHDPPGTKPKLSADP